MNGFLEFRKEWTAKFRAMSDEELITSFNGKVGLKTFGILISIHLGKLENEFLSRNWDCSEVISVDPNTNEILSVSYAFPVKLVDNKLQVIRK